MSKAWEEAESADDFMKRVVADCRQEVNFYGTVMEKKALNTSVFPPDSNASWHPVDSGTYLGSWMFQGQESRLHLYQQILFRQYYL